MKPGETTAEFNERRAKMKQELGVQAQVMVELHRDDPVLYNAKSLFKQLEKRYDEIAQQYGDWK